MYLPARAARRCSRSLCLVEKRRGPHESLPAPGPPFRESVIEVPQADDETPEEVSAAFMHALFHEQPLRRYVVVPNQDEQALVIGRKLQQLLELNQWGPHRYSRDELVAMLDQLLTETSE